MTLVTNTLPSIALLARMCAPSGLQLGRAKKRLLGAPSKGFVIDVSHFQSAVRQIFIVLSSEAVAMNCPTGSKQTPLMKPACPSILRKRSNVRPL